MITNPQTHQRGAWEKTEGAQKKERKCKTEIFSALWRDNKTGLVFIHIPRERQAVAVEGWSRDRNRRRIGERPQTSEHKRETAPGEKILKREWKKVEWKTESLSLMSLQLPLKCGLFISSIWHQDVKHYGQICGSISPSSISAYQSNRHWKSHD